MPEGEEMDDTIELRGVRYAVSHVPTIFLIEDQHQDFPELLQAIMEHWDNHQDALMELGYWDKDIVDWGFAEAIPMFKLPYVHVDLGLNL